MIMQTNILKFSWHVRGAFRGENPPFYALFSERDIFVCMEFSRIEDTYAKWQTMTTKCTIEIEPNKKRCAMQCHTPYTIPHQIPTMFYNICNNIIIKSGKQMVFGVQEFETLSISALSSQLSAFRVWNASHENENEKYIGKKKIRLFHCID